MPMDRIAQAQQRFQEALEPQREGDFGRAVELYQGSLVCTRIPQGTPLVC